MSEKLIMNSQTKDNLLAAMHGEAFAYVKYMLFAERARKNGRADLADLFESIAKVERFEHFAEEAELVGLVGTDEENLQDAITGENYQVDTMYGDFAQQARNAGDQAVADRFGEIRRGARAHRDLYKAAAANLSTPIK
jgi:rubrerythrin